MNEINFFAAAYERLSREDGDKTESDSIETQRKIITQFTKEHPEIEIKEEYIDDGFTGTNFNRPDFLRMIEAIETKKINCVIVKDLSRFGRDYIEAGRYLERVFPSYEVRFISINDGIDSFKKAYDIMMPFKNLINTMYAQDVSNKVQSAFLAKQKSGEFIGPFACYGYMKNPKNKHQLIIDEYAAGIVKKIYRMYVKEGYSQRKIAATLNEEGVYPPNRYKESIGLNVHKRCIDSDSVPKWSYITIHQILTNQIYVGDMVQRKYTRSMPTKKAKAIPKSEQIIVENTHAPIINRELFNEAQDLIKIKARGNEPDKKRSIFTGFVFCGDCGSPMGRSDTKYSKRLICGRYKRFGKDGCSPHQIDPEVLEHIILEDLNGIIKKVENIEELYRTSLTKKNSRKKLLEKEIKKQEANLQRTKSAKFDLYKDYKSGVITESDYFSFKEKFEADEASTNNRMTSLKNDLETCDGNTTYNIWMEKLIKTGNIEKLDRETIVELIDNIIVYEGKGVEIFYKFQNDLDAILTDEILEYTP